MVSKEDLKENANQANEISKSFFDIIGGCNTATVGIALAQIISIFLAMCEIMEGNGKGDHAQELLNRGSNQLYKSLIPVVLDMRNQGMDITEILVTIFGYLDKQFDDEKETQQLH